MLKKIEKLEHVAKIVLRHYERLDDSGYPNGLFGENILIEAKNVAVADVVAAMSSFITNCNQ